MRLRAASRAAVSSKSCRCQSPIPGRCSQGAPVRSTNRMPFKTCSLLSLGLPPLGEATATGSNGLILLYNAAVISLFLFFPMPHQTHSIHLTMTAFVSRS